MAQYDVCVDYVVVFRTTVEADTPKEAFALAEEQASQDSWSSGGTWGGISEYVECELSDENEGRLGYE